ncbi:integrin alpha-M-like [Hyperolius riggenbachi]|uniref:integrin alpha-M-like n=1 Tax=Hyperolius riggenbachi TaxID=752182 RepID=UPI0035A33ADD
MGLEEAVLSYSVAFFLDTEDPIVFYHSDRSFGYKVVQLKEGVIVSAPLQQVASNKSGQLYRCDPQRKTCTPISIPELGNDNRTSLGLTMAAQLDPPQLIVCDPTLQRTCGHNIYVNGRCYKIGKNLTIEETLPTSLPECILSLDIVFLLDGSSSVKKKNFNIMMDFVYDVISFFMKTDTQFALAQYSESKKFEKHFDFTRFPTEKDLKQALNITYQTGKDTFTYDAIKKVINRFFVPHRRLRDKSQQLLIVITDGDPSPHDNLRDEAISLATKYGIQRISIGIGKDFQNRTILEKLKFMASSPDYVFSVTDFSALDQILHTLQNRIFTIEGTQSQNLSSFHMEVSQEGFSAALTPNGIILGAVGAYDWSGGAYVYRTGRQNATWINTTDHMDTRDSYLGYSVLNVEDLLIIGAPRYKHIGRVLIYRHDRSTSQWKQKASISGELIGSYFGSVLSGVPVNNSHALLLVGAPTYYSLEGPGGRVYLCTIPTQNIKSVNPMDTFATVCPETLKGDSSQSVGFFGSAISILPDLTGDQLQDLAVGAPCEDNYKGAIYIFAGQPGGFRKSYIQRVAGSPLGNGIKLFGRSLSGNLDMTGDGLPDLVVGSEGQVRILRSRPVVSLSVSMEFQPREIPLSSHECSLFDRGAVATVFTVCFTQTWKNTPKGGAMAHVNYTAILDPLLIVTRAFFTSKPGGARTVSQTLDFTEKTSCAKHTIYLPECVKDSLTPLQVSLRFSLLGTSLLSEESRSNHSAKVLFEKNCGGDGVCDDDLKITISFVSSVRQLMVGEDLDIGVNISVKNEGDDSYNARVLLPFPSGLSYRRVTEINKNMVVSCETVESQKMVTCEVNKPLLRPNTTVVFQVDFHVDLTANFGGTLKMNASVTSDNRASSNNTVKASCEVRVQYAIYVTITSLEKSTKYNNFSSEESTIEHLYKVINLGQRCLPLSIIFLVPVKLGNTTVWKDITIISSQPKTTNCTIGEVARLETSLELPSVDLVLNCSVAQCVRAECNVQDLQLQDLVIFTIRGRVTKEWTMEIERKKITLQSSAEIVYDTKTYHQNLHFTQAQAQTVLEVLDEYDYIPLITGSSVGGLLLFALITFALYKVGFFRRQYREKLVNPEENEKENVETESEICPDPKWRESTVRNQLSKQ